MISLIVNIMICDNVLHNYYNSQSALIFHSDLDILSFLSFSSTRSEQIELFEVRFLSIMQLDFLVGKVSECTSFEDDGLI